jgi:PAS domain S-box-containing protein
MTSLELACLLFALVAFGIAALASRRRRADIGWWTWSWAVLILAGVGLELGSDRGPLWAGGAVLAVVFPGMQLAGAYEYTERSLPRWLIPGFVSLALVRLAVALAGFEAHSHLTVVAFELAALIAASSLVLRSRRASGLSPVEWAITIGFPVIGAAEVIDAVLDIGGAGVAWPVWLAIGVPAGSCQVLATFDRMQYRLAASLGQREQALRVAEESNERFRAIAEEADDIIVVADADQGILYANPRFYETLGYAPDAVLGRRIGEFVWDQDDFPTHSDLVGRRRMLLGPVRVRHRDGSQGWLEASIRSYLHGQEQRLVVVARDVTERRRSEEQQRKARELESLGLMAGGIAHDFNNLLVGILGNADLALAELPPGHPASGLLKLVMEASQQAAQLTQQLQAYSGAGPFELRPVDLSEEVRSRADLLRTAVAGRAALEFDLDDDLPAVEADPGLLFQAVLNLTVNGAEACTEAGGLVKLTTGLTRIREGEVVPGSEGLASGQHVFVEVEDNGRGVDESIRERIFDPFFTTNETGRGLGLAVVHGVVKSLGGGMTVESTRDGGSRFRLFLRTSSPIPRRESGPQREGIGGSERLLLVDDNPTVREVMRAALSRYGYQPVTASSGEQARQIVADQEIALVLLDAVLPGEASERILEDLRALQPDIRVLLVSGYAEAEAMRRFARSDELAGFLRKPFTHEELATRVRRVLDDRP